MKRRNLLLLAVVVPAVLLAPGGRLALATEPAAAHRLAALQAWIDGTRDLRARFEQELVSGALGAGVVERGRMTLLRPGMMRWDYEKPERKVALIDGDRTRLWVEADRQLWEGELERDEGLLPTLLAGARPLAEVFEVEAVEPDAEDRPGLRLVPVGEREAFSEVVLRLRAADHAIEEAAVLDAAGNRVRYRFSRLRRNRGVDPAAFHFEPPAGTEIIAQP